MDTLCDVYGDWHIWTHIPTARYMSSNMSKFLVASCYKSRVTSVKAIWIWIHFSASYIALPVLVICVVLSASPIIEYAALCTQHIDGLVQERCNYIAIALELHLSCTNPCRPSLKPSWALFDYKERLSRYGDFQYKYKMAAWLSCLYNGNPYSGKTVYSYWDTPWCFSKCMSLDTLRVFN